MPKMIGLMRLGRDAELRPYAGRPGAPDAFAMPSRMGSRLHWPDGRITTINHPGEEDKT